jgi:hypothetical protein
MKCKLDTPNNYCKYYSFEECCAPDEFKCEFRQKDHPVAADVELNAITEMEEINGEK